MTSKAPIKKSTKIREAFDYDTAKLKYLDTLSNINMERPHYKILSIDRIHYIKGAVKIAKDKVMSGHSLTPSEQNTINVYDILETPKECKLLLIKNSNKRPLEQIAYQEMFDLLIEAHLSTQHGGRDKIMRYLKAKYVVSRTCVDLVISLCKICEKSKEKVFNSECYIFVIDMSANPDGHFQFLLVLRDYATGFTQLRPLTSLSITEVAIELFKVFSDFGPPRKISVKNAMYFTEVCRLLNKISAGYYITVGTGEEYNLLTWSNHIQMYFRDWSADVKNWVTGCYLVQWKINNTPDEVDQTPYESVFGEPSSAPVDIWSRQEDSEVIHLSDDNTQSENEQLAAVQKTHSKNEENIILTEMITSKIYEALQRLESLEVNAETIAPTSESTDKSARDEISFQDSNRNASSTDTVLDITENGYQPHENDADESHEQASELVNDIQKVLQDDNGKISVISVQISEDEMDVDDDDVREIVMCSYCNAETNDNIICQRCHKPAHTCCSKELHIFGKLGITCFTCLLQIKKKMEELKNAQESEFLTDNL